MNLCPACEQRAKKDYPEWDRGDAVPIETKLAPGVMHLHANGNDKPLCAPWWEEPIKPVETTLRRDPDAQKA